MRIPYLPTKVDRLRELEKHLDLRPGDRFVDLGSGGGHVIRYFASRYPDVMFYGVEKDPVLYSVSRRKAAEFRNIVIVKDDLFMHDLSRYDVIYTYLTSDALMRLRNKVVKHLDKGGIWVAHDYPIPGLKPSEVVKVDKWHRFYIYRGR